MNPQLREFYIARVCSGSVRVHMSDKTYVIKRPTSEQLYVGHEVYADYLEHAVSEGLFDESELLSFLMTSGFWDMKKNALLEALPKEIDQFKVALFKSQFKSKEKQVIRKALNTARAKYAELAESRGMYDFLSCSGIASFARSKYLVGSSTYLNNTRIFTDNFWNEDSNLLEEVMSAYSRTRFSEATYRELARNEPWRSIWMTNKRESSLFGIPAIEYTEEQRNLVCWSLFYDDIYAHPNCPTEDVINDDDILDGWAIEQKRLRDAAMGANAADDIVKNEKIRNSQEVYLVAETHDDARKIDGLNTEQASITKKARFAALAKHGELNEMQMPDTAKRLRQEVTQRLSQAMSAR